ncbi:MAG: hypothetical protein M1429_02405 [Patescibacteria group bacterium]|nr:hypothetical protein [Patescibacteria group bacterium]
MERKQISQDDLKKLLRSISEIVELQIKYIDQGFDAGEIASTFATIYSRQFERLLTPEIAAKIGRDSYQQSPPCNSNAAISYCLTLCSAMMKVVTGKLKK